MKKLLILIFTVFIFGTISGAFGQNNSNQNQFISAQTSPSGQYWYRGKVDKQPFNFYLTFQTAGVAIYSYEYQGAGTIKGTWSFENGIVTVVLPNGDSTLQFKLKQKGDNLEVIENPQQAKPIINAGTIFKKAVESPAGPTLTALEFNNRVVNFTKNVRTIKDLSPKNLQRKMAVKVLFNDEDRNTYGFWGKIPDTFWRYGVTAYPYPSKGNKTTDTVRFSLDSTEENAEMNSVCVEIESYRQELSKAGFSFRNSTGVHSVVNGLVFSRDNVFVHVLTQGYGTNFEDIKKKCVRMVIIGVSDARN